MGCVWYGCARKGICLTGSMCVYVMNEEDDQFSFAAMERKMSDEI